ncbi:hypothetical protein FEM03_13450 [Phragmitibacter flavus]|uniref:Uncharacterized protein n=1 Tax=Phragmitibacter flavus TaxID=2576071 RepID=A0A5R8KD18_9BACT|nr:hypothetical protein [Phragmitibacter flavus]TLD70191.1 hypothetical protein FEM03_13450 [Phragmitibacter flavus]
MIARHGNDVNGGSFGDGCDAITGGIDNVDRGIDLAGIVSLGNLCGLFGGDFDSVSSDGFDVNFHLSNQWRILEQDKSKGSDGE